MAKKKGGRPPGRRNTTRKVVLCRPAACPTCGRTVRVNLSTKPKHTHPHPGEIQGHAFEALEYRHYDCPCGQGLTVSTPVNT